MNGIKVNAIFILIMVMVVPAYAQTVQRTPFSNLDHFFSYALEDLGLGQGIEQDKVVHLAADSAVDYSFWRGEENIWIVRPAYYIEVDGRYVNKIRSTSGNGLFYALEKNKYGLFLVGKFEGAEYFSGQTDRRRAVVTKWKKPAGDGYRIVYAWDGEVFHELPDKF